MSKAEDPVPGRWLYAVGGGLTVLYLLLLGGYCIDRWQEIRGLQPNNIGDFLAGAFSPLAFTWLVLGFIQQGIDRLCHSRQCGRRRVSPKRVHAAPEKRCDGCTLMPQAVH